MRKSLALIGVLLVLLAACSPGESTSTPVDVSAVQTSVVQTVFAGATQTAITNIPTDTPVPTNTSVPTATATFAMTGNGQLQGILAFIRNDNLWVSINATETQLTTDAIPTELPHHTGLPKLWYSNPQISPNGTQVAYLKNTYDVSTYEETRALVVSNIDGANARQLADDVAENLPAVAWSNDSQQIYYPVSNGMDTTTGLEPIEVKSINPTTGEIIDQGQFAQKRGCGGGSSDDADHISGAEGIGGLGQGQVFALSPQNNYVMHSTSCGGGLGILDLPTKQDRTLGDGSGSTAAISADGSRIAAISGNNLVIFNATSGNIEQTYSIPEPPRALAWDHDGTAIFYSTSKSIGTQDLDKAVALEVFNNPDLTITLQLSTLWKLSLDSGESVKIIDMEVHDLKPIFASDQKVLVGAIENASVLFDYLTQGNRENIAEHFPSVNLVEVDLTTLASNIITQKTIQADYFSTR